MKNGSRYHAWRRYACRGHDAINRKVILHPEVVSRRRATNRHVRRRQFAADVKISLDPSSARNRHAWRRHRAADAKSALHIGRAADESVLGWVLAPRQPAARSIGEADAMLSVLERSVLLVAQLEDAVAIRIFAAEAQDGVATRGLDQGFSPDMQIRFRLVRADADPAEQVDEQRIARRPCRGAGRSSPTAPTAGARRTGRPATRRILRGRAAPSGGAGRAASRVLTRSRRAASSA